MKKVDFQHAAEGQELSFLTLQLIQEGALESMQSIVRALNVSSNEITVLWGLEAVTDGTDYAITAGAVYYNDEIHLVDAFVGNSAVHVPVLKANFIDLEGPIRFTSQNEYSVYFDNKLMIELDVAGAGIIDLIDAKRIKTQLEELIDITSKFNDFRAEIQGGASANFDDFGKIEAAFGGFASIDQGQWTDIILEPEYSVRQGQKPQYRADKFGVVHLRGQLSIDAGGDFVTDVGAVPPAPTGSGAFVGFAITYLNAATDATGVIRLTISNNGQLSLPAGFPASMVNGSFYLDGVSYATDPY